MAGLGLEEYIKYLNEVIGFWPEWEAVPPREGLTKADAEATKARLMQLSDEIDAAETNLKQLQLVRRREMQTINAFAPRLRTLVQAFYAPNSSAVKLLPVLFHKQALKAEKKRAIVRAAKKAAKREAAKEPRP